MSFQNFELDFSGISWADMVFEEEEELRKSEEIKKRKKKVGVRSGKSKRNLDEDSQDTLTEPLKCLKTPVKSPAKRFVSFQHDEDTQSSPKRFKSYRTKRPLDEDSQDTLTESLKIRKITAKKSPKKSAFVQHNEDNQSTFKSYRTKRLLDEDSQDTLTESLQIRKAPVKKSPKKHIDDNQSTSKSFTRTKRPLNEHSQDTLTESTKIRKTIAKKSPMKSPKKSAIRHDEDSQSTMTDRPKRHRRPPANFPNPEIWVDPKNGYETDPAILARREKDIRYGYASEIYRKYFDSIPKSQRIKGVHPKTPNKFLKVPRRSWDTQIRVWRRMLYAAMNIDAASDCSFLSHPSDSSANTSFCSVDEQT